MENGEWVEVDGESFPVSVPAPVTVTPALLERCCLCNSHTISGIYVRKDPLSVPFPTLIEDEDDD